MRHSMRLLAFALAFAFAAPALISCGSSETPTEPTAVDEASLQLSIDNVACSCASEITVRPTNAVDLIVLCGETRTFRLPESVFPVAIGIGQAMSSPVTMNFPQGKSSAIGVNVVCTANGALSLSTGG